MAETIDGGRYLSVDGVTYVDAFGKPVDAPKNTGDPSKVEKQLEAETGKDFVTTGSNPPTLAETDKPAPHRSKR